jgi:hypothetical protein
LEKVFLQCIQLMCVSCRERSSLAGWIVNLHS